MSDFNDFNQVADGTVFPDQVVNISRVEIPARSQASPANLYVRICGIGNFDLDPLALEQWRRGMMAVKMPALRLGDTMLEASANIFFREINREEESSSDDFAIALDEVILVNVNPAGELVITFNVAYMGDVWAKRVGFAVNLLVHRPSLDNLVPDHPAPFSLDDIIHEYTTLELHYPKRSDL